MPHQEGADSVDSLRLELGHDVDEYAAARQAGVLPGGDERADPAARGADEHRRTLERRDDREQVGDEAVERV